MKSLLALWSVDMPHLKTFEFMSVTASAPNGVGILRPKEPSFC